MASSHREPWLAATEGGRQRFRAKTFCDCGFLKSSVDAKEDTSQQGSDCRVRHTYAEWERETLEVVAVAAEDWTRGQDEGRWPAGGGALVRRRHEAAADDAGDGDLSAAASCTRCRNVT